MNLTKYDACGPYLICVIDLAFATVGVGTHENIRLGKPARIAFNNINQLIIVKEMQWVFYKWKELV
jgi:hypothetical protein